MAQINFTGSIGVPGSVWILGNVAVEMPADANYTLAADEYSNTFLDVTSAVALTATRNLIAPLNQGQQFDVLNATTGGQNIQIIGATGSGITIANGDLVSVVCDGTSYRQASGAVVPGTYLELNPTGDQIVSGSFATNFEGILNVDTTAIMLGDGSGGGSASFANGNATINTTGEVSFEGGAIRSDGAGGFVIANGDFTVDTSGNVNIGSSNILLAADGTATTKALMTGASGDMQLEASSSGGGYSNFTFNGNNTDGLRLGFVGGGTGDASLYLDVPSGGGFVFREDNADVFIVGAGGILQLPSLDVSEMVATNGSKQLVSTGFAAGDIALLDATQTFTGVNTFDNDVIVGASAILLNSDGSVSFAGGDATIDTGGNLLGTSLSINGFGVAVDASGDASFNTVNVAGGEILLDTDGSIFSSMYEVDGSTGIATFAGIAGNGGTPTGVLSANAGTGANVSIVGTNLAGTITVTPGTGAVGGTQWLTMTFAGGGFSSTPHFQLAQLGFVATGLDNSDARITTISATGFTVNVDGTTFSATPLIWSYLMVQ